MTSSESDNGPSRRKRSRTDNSTSNGNDDGPHKKARGRPRVETHDATAADRRRTQIRLAQRAYRQRKETTISSLKKQNTRLRSIIEEMNQSLLHFKDSATQSGLQTVNTDLTRELKDLTEVFARLAQAAATEGNSEMDDEGEIDPATELQHAATVARSHNESQQRQEEHGLQFSPEHGNSAWQHSGIPGLSNIPSFTTQPTGVPSSAQLYATSRPVSSATDSPHALWQVGFVRGRRTRGPTVGQLFDQSRPTEDESESNEQTLPFGLVDIRTREPSPFPFQHYRVFPTTLPPTPDLTPPHTRLPTPPPTSQMLEPSLTIGRTLSSNFTYSFQESTFARRLARASLEGGFQLLSSLNTHPAVIRHVFKLSLPFMDLNRLRDKFREILSRGTDESLDSLDTPFLHLGGAGMHYPKRDEHGNVVLRPNAWLVRNVGPHQKVVAENIADPSLSHNLPIDMKGYEGEWFDSYDVQGYLEEEKGLFINAQDSFAECFVEVEDDSDAVPESMSFSKGPSINLAISEGGPPNSNGSGNVDNLTSASTTAPSVTATDSAFGQSNTSSQRTESPFGLDMGGASFPDFGKLSDVDAALMFEQPLGLDLAGAFDPNTSLGPNPGAFGNFSNLGLDIMGSAPGELSVGRRKQKKPVLVDVAKLIDEIVKKGVCLGRAPGFRRQDVDTALKAALVQVY